MLEWVPKSLLVIAVAACLFCNAVLVHLVLRVESESKQRDVLICKSGNRTTSQSNRANESIASVLNQSLANIQSRANTSKELPSDKQSIGVYVKLIANLRTSEALNCPMLG